MKLPLGMYQLRQVRERLFYRLLRSLYGLKQSERLWNQNVIAFFMSIGFRQLNGDPSILIWQSDTGEISIVSVYIDDFLLASDTIKNLDKLKVVLSNAYDIKDLNKVKTIIGWQITRDLVAQTMKIDQSAFIWDLVMEENLYDCNANVVPIKTGSAIDISDVNAYKEKDLYTYQQLIGKLMYLACKTRPDIAFAIGQLSRHNADPQRSHFRAAKKVVWYLKGTINLGLVYGRTTVRDSLSYGLIGLADSNFAEDQKDCKLVMGYCFFLNRAIVL